MQSILEKLTTVNEENKLNMKQQFVAEKMITASRENQSKHEI